MKLWKCFVLVLALAVLATSLMACGGEVETTPDVTTPETTEPEVTTPDATEPEVTEPDVTEPEAIEPEFPATGEVDPDQTDEVDVEITAPEVTEPEDVEPTETESEGNETEEIYPDTTEPAETEPEVTEPVETACPHPEMKEKVLKFSTCYTSGEVEQSCSDCGYKVKVVTPPSHEEEAVYTASSGITEYVCSYCDARAMILKPGSRMKLSAHCEGDLAFSVEAVAGTEVEVLLDGVSQGNIALNEKGKGSVRFENLEKGGYGVVFINKGDKDVRIMNDEINGYFNRPGAVYVEVLAKGSQAYSSFKVYIQTSDPSGEYYVGYNFDYRLDRNVNNFAGNSCTNTEFYRLNGATLYRVVDVDDTSIKTERVSKIGNVLGGGEISFAVMQQYPYVDSLAEGAKVEMGSLDRAPDFIGGFHGDEWMSEVTLIADGEVIDLQSSKREVIPCSMVTFDLTGTMYAWGTSTAQTRGVPVAEHVQNFVMDSTGVTDVQTLTWLRNDFVIHAAYLPMFTMMRGADGDRFIETMRAYDADGNMLGEYVMPSDYIVEKQTSILYNTNASVYEYTGDKGVSSVVSFKSLRDGIKFNSSRIDLRVGVDNKLYVGVGSAVGGNAIPEGEVWEVELKFHIDYTRPEA